jgi:hypothetical protein
MMGDQSVHLGLGCFVAFLASQVISCSGPVTPSTHPGCPGACEQGSKLECSWADDGCMAFCDAYHSVGYMRPWADCVGASTTVEHVEQCGMSCK